MNILYIHGLSSSGESRTARTLRKLLPEDNIISPDLPIDPEEALDLLHRIVEEEKIDLAIGTSMGGMFAQQLHGIKKILVNPAFHVSEIMRNNIGTQLFLNPRKDGATSYEITSELCDKYKAVERNQFENYKREEKNKATGLFGIKDHQTVNCIEEFSKYYGHAIQFNGGHRLSNEEIQFILVPLIERVRPHAYDEIPNPVTKILKEEIEQGISDRLGGIYSTDGKRLLKYIGTGQEYTVKDGTETICDFAFLYTDSNSHSPIEKIVLPKSVRQIGKDAFRHCENLSTINIPEGVSYIGSGAFWGCHSLVEIVLPDSLTVISRMTFMFCFALESCKFGLNVRTIGNSAFYGCAYLQNIQLPEFLEKICDAAFCGTGLTDVRIPISVQYIGAWAFSRCYFLKTVSIASPQCKFGDNPFSDTDVNFESGCSNYKTIRKSLINIKSGVLVNCHTHRKKYQIPQEVRIIGHGAFEDAKVHTLVIPPTVESVLSFGLDCESLQTLVLCNPNISLKDTFEPALSVIGGSNIKTIFVPTGYGDKIDRYCSYQSIRHPNEETHNIEIKEFEFTDMSDVDKLLDEIHPH